MQNNHHAGSQTTFLQAHTPDCVPSPIHTTTYYPTPRHTNLPTTTHGTQSSIPTTYMPSQTLLFILVAFHH
jgi:hypothetical protein